VFKKYFGIIFYKVVGKDPSPAGYASQRTLVLVVVRRKAIKAVE